MPPPLAIELVAFVLGLLFGSFLNVCISRLPAHESIVEPRSHCPACGHAIRWYDNIPLLSWLALRASCRDCKQHISARYPLVELATGLWFLTITFECIRASLIGLYVQHPVQQSVPIILTGIALAILGFLLIGLLVMDWQTQRLPDAFTLTGIAIGLFLVCTQAIFLAPGQGDVILDPSHQIRLSSPGSTTAHGNVFLTGPEALIFGRIAAIAAAALILLTVRWLYKAVRKRDGMGLGDVKMLAMIAAFLGFTQTLLALFVGVLTASLYGLTLLARRRANRATQLPLGSFLAIGGLTAALLGQPIVTWYASLFH